MTPSEFLDKVYPYLKRYAANLHERVGLRIDALNSTNVDTSTFTEEIERDLYGLANKFGSGHIQDSRTGEIRPDEFGPTWEFYLTIKTLFYLEVIRQASEIHTGRGKIQDTQYAFCKEAVRQYFASAKGNPDDLYLREVKADDVIPLCPNCRSPMEKKLIDEIPIFVCPACYEKAPVAGNSDVLP